MTTKLGDRRRTQQPELKVNTKPAVRDDQEQIDGIYERHGTAEMTPMQLFDKQ